MMTLPMKTLLLPLGILLLIAMVYRSSDNSGYADNIKRNAAEPRIIRHRRTIKPTTMHYCKFNQYYDQEEGRCLGVPGGGKVLHVENRQSCGINVLKPHCKSSLYYHICKRDKSILAQCASRQIFNNRLQRCVYYDPSKFTPDIISPDSYMYYDHVGVPNCTRSGRYPVLGHCSMFYTCDTNGHRFYQSVFKCPQNTGYQVDRGVCSVVPNCLNDNSVDTVCVPDAPGENVESPSIDEAAERDEKETPEILEESKTSANDPVVEREKNINSMIDEGTTPESIMSTPLENNDNENNMDVSNNNANLSKSIKDVPVSDDTAEGTIQVPNLPETVQKVSDEGQNEENGSSSLLELPITSPSTTELDDASHSITTSMTLIKPEYRTNTDVDSETTDAAPFSTDSYILSKVSERTQDVTTEQYKNDEDSTMTLSNFNTGAIDSVSTITNVPETSPVSDISPNIDEKIQDTTTEQYKNNEESVAIPSNFNTDLGDPYSTSTITNIPESLPVSDISPNIDEKMQDTTTEQYRNDEDSTAIPSNFNTDSYSTPTVTDVPEPSPISETPSKLDEEIPNVTTEMYQKDDKRDEIIAPMVIATTISPIQDSSISDSDLITQDGKDNTETPTSFIE